MHVEYKRLVVLIICYVTTKGNSETVASECIHSFGKSCTCDTPEMKKTATTSLGAVMASLQTNLNHVIKQFNMTQEGLASAVLSINQGDTSLLSATERLLGKTQAELAVFFGAANAQLTQIRQTLNESNYNFTVCKDLERYNQTVSKLPYVTHYCGFERWWTCNYNQDGCYNTREECWYEDSGRQNTRSGPIEDHTFGTPHGHYLYIDPFKQPTYVNHPSDVTSNRNRTAAILTSVLPPGPQYCVRFWYTMYGSDVGTMTVYVQNADRYSRNQTQVFQLSGEVDQYWHMAEIPLKSEETRRPFKVVIKATTNSYKKYYVYNAYAYIAIDDLYVYNTSCISIPMCPAGAQHFTDGNQTSCYTFHVLPLTWFDAVKTCKSEAPNGHLVSINSKREEDFLAQVIASVSNSNAWYTSGNDEEIEGQFKWTDTGYPYSLSYTNWLPAQPDDVNNTQQCLAMEQSGAGYQWNDVNCDTKYSYICEIHM